MSRWRGCIFWASPGLWTQTTRRRWSTRRARRHWGTRTGRVFWVTCSLSAFGTAAMYLSKKTCRRRSSTGSSRPKPAICTRRWSWGTALCMGSTWRRTWSYQRNSTPRPLSSSWTTPTWTIFSKSRPRWRKSASMTTSTSPAKTPKRARSSSTTSTQPTVATSRRRLRWLRSTTLEPTGWSGTSTWRGTISSAPRQLGTRTP
mmetsp:Transcript_9300/g.23292  ORF Transcript_9300/g.23292 Transcript_9300/m.23292 type:complete len:202 (-) Transcript_9300:996-1601(-)